MGLSLALELELGLEEPLPLLDEPLPLLDELDDDCEADDDALEFELDDPLATVAAEASTALMLALEPADAEAGTMARAKTAAVTLRRWSGGRRMWGHTFLLGVHVPAYDHIGICQAGLSANVMIHPAACANRML